MQLMNFEQFWKKLQAELKQEKIKSLLISGFANFFSISIRSNNL